LRLGTVGVAPLQIVQITIEKEHTGAMVPEMSTAAAGRTAVSGVWHSRRAIELHRHFSATATEVGTW
jgi:hypothetical protein